MALLFLSLPDRAEVFPRMFDAAKKPILIGEAAVTDAAEVNHLRCWRLPEDLHHYPNLKVVISPGAGVDLFGALPSVVALVRTVTPAVEEMVRDWIVMATLMLNHEMPVYLAQAARGDWNGHRNLPARTRRLGVMGLGRIGRLTAQSLTALGFPVAGWGRSGTPLEGCEVFAGAERDVFIARSDLMICSLPLTPETHGLMDAEFLAKLPMGARLVQAGNGAQLDLNALRDALETGRLASAMLDVSEPASLPRGHWIWSDPWVLLTPNIAPPADSEDGARHALAAIQAIRSGTPFPGLVDRARGYLDRRAGWKRAGRNAAPVRNTEESAAARAEFGVSRGRNRARLRETGTMSPNCSRRPRQRMPGARKGASRWLR